MSVCCLIPGSGAPGPLVDDEGPCQHAEVSHQEVHQAKGAGKLKGLKLILSLFMLQLETKVFETKY